MDPEETTENSDLETSSTELDEELDDLLTEDEEPEEEEVAEEAEETPVATMHTAPSALRASLPIPQGVSQGEIDSFSERYNFPKEAMAELLGMVSRFAGLETQSLAVGNAHATTIMQDNPSLQSLAPTVQRTLAMMPAGSRGTREAADTAIAAALMQEVQAEGGNWEKVLGQLRKDTARAEKAPKTPIAPVSRVPSSTTSSRPAPTKKSANKSTGLDKMAEEYGLSRLELGMLSLERGVK